MEVSRGDPSAACARAQAIEQSALILGMQVCSWPLAPVVPASHMPMDLVCSVHIMHMRFV